MFVKMGSIIVNTERVTHLTTIPSGNKYEIVLSFDNGRKTVVAFPSRDELEQTLRDCEGLLNREVSM